MVSVCVVTYNHEKFIKETLDSILSQNTDFCFDIVIGEDCSLDHTREIIIKYQKKYPDLIKLIISSSNVGAQQNGARTLNACHGKYIAVCDGDDYWTDPNKLQKQVNFLEENEDYVMSFHSVDIKNSIPKGEMHSNYKYPIPIKNTLTLKDLAFKHYIPTCSLVFRAKVIPKPLPEWFHKCSMGDIPLELIIASKGLTKYIDEPMAVYRKHAMSITANKAMRKKGRKSYLYIYKNLRRQLGARYWIIFSVLIIKHRLGILKDYFGFNPILK